MNQLLKATIEYWKSQPRIEQLTDVVENLMPELNFIGFQQDISNQNQSNSRNITIMTGAGGYELFNQALRQESENNLNNI